MMKQNITLSIDQDLIKKARALAASRNTSVSRMLGNELARIVEEAETYERARRKALTFLDKGFRFGGSPAARETLHDREGFR